MDIPIYIRKMQNNQSDVKSYRVKLSPGSLDVSLHLNANSGRQPLCVRPTKHFIQLIVLTLSRDRLVSSGTRRKP